MPTFIGSLPPIFFDLGGQLYSDGGYAGHFQLDPAVRADDDLALFHIGPHLKFCTTLWTFWIRHGSPPQKDIK
jgi:hypothetical protein